MIQHDTITIITWLGEHEDKQTSLRHCVNSYQVSYHDNHHGNQLNQVIPVVYSSNELVILISTTISSLKVYTVHTKWTYDIFSLCKSQVNLYQIAMQHNIIILMSRSFLVATWKNNFLFYWHCPNRFSSYLMPSTYQYFKCNYVITFDKTVCLLSISLVMMRDEVSEYQNPVLEWF